MTSGANARRRGIARFWRRLRADSVLGHRFQFRGERRDIISGLNCPPTPSTGFAYRRNSTRLPVLLVTSIGFFHALLQHRP
ncbi:unnamed protein product [Gongylonema pulchrum]|uniref:DUF1534 domain-containing protein n=1 Tax=Gongylonema pulchrum TaxID=637853 RepID=A0A183DU19_9BILA|nr:unnamed protein product [Gongylonema pulchrum]